MHEGFGEEGIPGHAGRGVPGAFQRRLSEMGCQFEAEGDVTRIHLAGGVVEVKDEPGVGPIVEASIPLPVDPSTVGESLEGMRALLGLMTMLGRPLSYQLDDSLPQFPILRVKAVFETLEDAYEALAGALERMGC
ncbi:hypothetical protein [Aeropyrum camini]|uniref:Uncharacterized protein n=1 Tax=Aeropyrum camini SY1 = JCM 12091 TaxID=1198449 RepID=U3TCR5_9CREN|nr:hypothetical protein [Aeropyrum camini]BAN89758.1 hypothetical protein ACAM_0289 [Aeropyrum camini SY1 = JCM 12091]